ncbi:MAG: hypothetical protein Q4G58_04355 [bacterium]|nr:hypothetical protein [bacterium]
MKKDNKTFKIIHGILFGSAMLLIFLFTRILPKLELLESILLVVLVAVIWFLASALNNVFYIVKKEKK